MNIVSTTKKSHILLILVAFLLSCCAAPSNKISTPTVNVTSSPTLFPKSSFTPTFSPTSSFTYTSTPTLTYINTPTFESTRSFQRLESTQAFSLLDELLRNNGDCRLPCFWGITPGKSSPIDAINEFTLLSGISSSSKLEVDEGYIALEKLTGVIKIVNLISYSSVDRKVGLIYFHTQPFSQGQDPEWLYGSTLYSKTLNNLTLHSVLTEYGIPTEITFFIELNEAEPNAPDFWYTYLLYPKQGIFLQYTALAHYRYGSKYVTACPEESVIDLWVMPPNKNPDFHRSLPPMYPWDGYAAAYGIAVLPTDTAINLSLLDFYNKYKQVSYQCLTTSLENWPIYKTFYSTITH